MATKRNRKGADVNLDAALRKAVAGLQDAGKVAFAGRAETYRAKVSAGLREQVASNRGWTPVADVQGSAATPYRVSLNNVNGEVGCTCPGWRFHAARRCKHLGMVARAFDVPVSRVQLLCDKTDKSIANAVRAVA